MSGVIGGGFDFAITELKAGRKVRRACWSNSEAEVFGPGIFLVLKNPCPTGSNTEPYIQKDTTGLESSNPRARRGRSPWDISQADLLAEDWIVVEE